MLPAMSTYLIHVMSTCTTVWQEWSNSSLWKRVIAWERRRAASGYGIIWGDARTQIETNKEEFSADYHSVDWF